MMETKVKLLMETISKEKIKSLSNTSEASDQIWSKDYLNFKKTMQLMAHKNRVRWERVLREIFTDFNELFI